jgi:hypothetical protein
VRRITRLDSIRPPVASIHESKRESSLPHSGADGATCLECPLRTPIVRALIWNDPQTEA